MVKNPPANARDVRDAGSIPGMGRSGFPCSSVGKESACNAGDPGSVTVWKDPLEKEMANPLQYSGLENPHGQRSLAGYSPWGCKNQTQLK